MVAPRGFRHPPVTGKPGSVPVRLCDLAIDYGRGVVWTSAVQLTMTLIDAGTREGRRALTLNRLPSVVTSNGDPGPGAASLACRCA